MQQLEKPHSSLEESSYKTICRSGSTLMMALHNQRDKISISKKEEEGSDMCF